MEVFISTFFLSFILFLFINLLKKNYKDSEIYNTNQDVEDVEDLFEFNYINKVKILQFFSEETNFKRLKVLLDKNNDLVDKMNDLLNNNEEIYEEFQTVKFLYTYDYYGYFSLYNDVSYDIVINDETFNTSFGQLNVFKWFIENDYLLHIYE